MADDADKTSATGAFLRAAGRTVGISKENDAIASEAAKQTQELKRTKERGKNIAAETDKLSKSMSDPDLVAKETVKQAGELKRLKSRRDTLYGKDDD